MAKTPSNMIPLGTRAPSFTLPDTLSGKLVSLEEIKSEIATVVMFLCNHCPYVKLIQAKLVEMAKTYQAKGVQFVGISSNDATAYPQDGPDQMHIEGEQNGYTFPYLYDEDQMIAKAYQAACTPDFYIFDKELRCIYRGRFDDANPGNGKPVTGADLQQALDNILAGNAVDSHQMPSVGCNIKWRK